MDIISLRLKRCPSWPSTSPKLAALRDSPSRLDSSHVCRIDAVADVFEAILEAIVVWEVENEAEHGERNGRMRDAGYSVCCLTRKQND